MKSYSLRGSRLQLYSSINCLKLKTELHVVFYQTLKGSHDFPQMFLWMILIKNKSTVRRYSSTIVVSLRMWVFLTSFLTVISKREIISKIKHWELQKQPVTNPSFLGTQAIFLCVYTPTMNQVDGTLAFSSSLGLVVTPILYLALN